MIDCLSAEMRDALPDLIHGGLDPVRSAEVEAHLASCAPCSAELELLKAVVASTAPAPAMNVDRIVAALPKPTKHGFLLHRGGDERLSAPPSRVSRGFWSRPSLRIAATLAVVTAGGLSLLVGRDVLSPETQVGQSRAVRRSSLPAAVAVTPQETAPIAASSKQAEDLPATTNGRKGLSLLGDLLEVSDAHLAILLDEMDHMNAIPATEPEAVAPALGDSELDGGMQ